MQPCAGPPSHRYAAPPVATCEAARRALLSQGYVITASRADAISGSKRLIVKMEGMAGHAGTVPMDLRRDAFAACGGFPPIALMEDIAFSRALKRRGRPACLRACVRTK